MTYSDDFRNGAIDEVVRLSRENQQLREALEAALPIVEDRAAGGRMLTYITEAQKVAAKLRAALAPKPQEVPK